MNYVPIVTHNVFFFSADDTKHSGSLTSQSRLCCWIKCFLTLSSRSQQAQVKLGDEDRMKYENLKAQEDFCTSTLSN